MPSDTLHAPPACPAPLPHPLARSPRAQQLSSTHCPPRAEALDAAKQIARQHGCVVAISGAEDLVTDGSRLLKVSNGVPLLQQITATGCSGGPPSRERSAGRLGAAVHARSPVRCPCSHVSLT